jgi:hypothetical protein
MAELKLNNVIGMSESSGTITLSSATTTKLAVATGKDLETSTTGKIKQKGAFMQSSTHQALTLGA